MPKIAPAPKTAAPAANAPAPAPGDGKPAPKRATPPSAASAPADLNAALDQATRSLLEDSITLDAEQPVAPPAAVAAPENPAAEAEEPAAQEPAPELDPAEIAPTEEVQTEEADPADPPDLSDQDPAEALAEEATARGWPQSATKRLTKLLKERTALQAQLEGAQALRDERDALQAKLEAAESEADANPPAAPRQPPSVTAIERQLQQEIAVKEQWLETIETNPDGLVLTTAEGKEVTYTPEQLRRARGKFLREITSAEIRLEQHQAEMARQTAAHSQSAQERHPFLKDKTSREYQLIQQVLRAFPDVSRIPDHLAVLADAMAWRKQEAAKAAAAKAAPAPAKPAPAVRAPGKPAAAPAAVNPKAQAKSERTSDFLKTGNPESGKASILDLVE